MNKITNHKFQITNNNQFPNLKSQTNNKYDLEDRTLDFAKEVIHMCKKLPNNNVNFKLTDQIVRSAASIGANYREANDALGKKDFLNRLRIARKEAKETSFWLELILDSNEKLGTEIKKLTNECIELRNILSAIISKSCS